MLSRIIHFSVHNKLIVGLFVIALIIWGSFEVTRLPIDAVPDITDNQVQVITVSPSLGAPDIERLITFPIEQSVSSISGLKQIRSFSRFGLSLVTVVFNEETDVYWARQQIAESLEQLHEATRELGLKQEAIRQAQAELAKMRLESLASKAQVETMQKALSDFSAKSAQQFDRQQMQKLIDELNAELAKMRVR